MWSWPGLRSCSSRWLWLKVMVMEGELGERRLLMLERPLGGGGGGARLEYGQIWLLPVVARLDVVLVAGYAVALDGPADLLADDALQLLPVAWVGAGSGVRPG